MPAPPSRDPWRNFKAERTERPKAGKGILFILIVLAVILGGGLGAFLGVLFNPGPSRSSLDRMMEDTTQQMVVRAAIGGAIGAALGVWGLLKGWKSRGKDGG